MVDFGYSRPLHLEVGEGFREEVISDQGKRPVFKKVFEVTRGKYFREKDFSKCGKTN